MKADLSALARLRKQYGTMISDNPWPENGGKNGKKGWSKTVSADAHYETMSIGEMEEMGEAVQRIMLPDSHLYLWVTNRVLAQGVHLKVVAAWGFRPVTVVSWFKTTGHGQGQYVRGYTEHVVLCVRGSAGYRRLPDGKRAQGKTGYEVDEVIVKAPRGRRHSAKPTAIHDVAELVSPGPYVELFAREARKGWKVWGNGVQKEEL